jgi:hypothetical protein
MDPDVRANWAWLHPNQEWRNINVTPRFDTSARMAAGMWEALGRGRVDGVIAVDPVALAGLLRATGPEQIDGRTIGADNVVRELLHDQYVGVPLTDDAKAARRERLGRIATVVMSAVERGGWNARALVRDLGPVTAGRHLLAWSRDPDDERMWTAAGADGRIAPDELHVSVLNRNGTKLDQFLKVEATLGAPRGGRATLALRLRNDAPAGEPPYVAGPHPLGHSVAGEYEGIVLVTLPEGSTHAAIAGQRRLAVSGRDGPNTVIGTVLDLKRGEVRTLVVSFDVPVRSRGLVVGSSARVPAVEWSFRKQRFGDGLKTPILW